jgi:hypothetical protein
MMSMRGLPHWRRIWRAAVGVCVVAVAAIVWGVTAAGGSSVRTRLVSDPALTGRSAAKYRSTSSAAIDPTLVGELSVFGRARTTTDAVPSGLAQWMGSTLGQFVPALAESRRIVASDGETVYLAPGVNAICTGGTGAADSFCAPVGVLATGQAVSLDLCSPSLPLGQIQMEWMLPDSATHVAVRLSDGTTVLLPTSNVYIRRFPISGPLPSTIEWTASGAEHSADAGIPGDVKQQDCVHPS